MSESIEEVIWPALGLIFLLLGIVLITSILFSSFNPYDQIAFANAEKMRAAINQACATSGDVKLQSLELKQNTPTATWLFTILPRWLIRNNGDPNYLLYYEAFPPYEAVGWEVYHPFQYRLIAPITADKLNNMASNSVIPFAESVRTAYKGLRNDDLVDAVLINNIVLHPDFRPDVVLRGDVRTNTPGTAQDTSSGFDSNSIVKNFFGYGYWKFTEGTTTNPDFSRDNIFKFKNYLGLSTIEKTLVKYQPCGINSLCLKTRSGVYTFPLSDQCGSIKSVQLVYDAAGDFDTSATVKKTLGLYGTAKVTQLISDNLIKSTFKKFFLSTISYLTRAATVADLGAETVKRHMSFKKGDFYMASPCLLEKHENTEIVIRRTSCNTAEVSVPNYPDATYTPCVNVIKYPIFTYDSSTQKLRDTGKLHYACVEGAADNDDDNGLGNLPDVQYGPEDQCIQVVVTGIKDGYCWTPNPYLKNGDGIDGLWEAIKNADLIRGSVSFFFDPPIRSNSAFMENPNTIILFPTQTTLKQGDQFLEALGRKWWWGWP